MNIRQDIQGTTPQDLNKVNENFMSMWQKVYGNIDFADGNFNMKQRIMTQWIPIQGEGNLDSSYPLEIRFYIPPNVSKIKVSPLNVRSEHYRMDSSVARDNGGYASGDVALDLAGSDANFTIETTSETTCAEFFGNFDPTDPNNNASRPIAMVKPSMNLAFGSGREPSRWLENIYANGENDVEYSFPPYGKLRSNLGMHYYAPVYFCKEGSNTTAYIDLATLQHRHGMSHSHGKNQTKHTHTGKVSVNIPPHGHQLSEGIKVSTESPQNVEVFVNSMKVGSTLNGISSFSNVDISPYVIIGEWNVVKISCSNLARVVLYGIIELVNKY